MQAGQWRMYELTSSRPEARQASRRCIAGNDMRNERVTCVVVRKNALLLNFIYGEITCFSHENEDCRIYQLRWQHNLCNI